MWLIKKCAIFLLAAVFTSTYVHADNIIDIYQQARLHDAQYQKALLKYKGDVLTIAMSRSRYLPHVNFTHRYAHNDYESDQLDVSQLDISACADVTCVINRVDQLNQKGTQSSYDSQQAALVLTQPIYDATLLADNKKAEAFVESSKQELLAAEKELIMRVVAVYLSVLKAEDEKQALLAQIDSTRKLKTVAKKRYELGVGKESQMYEAEAYYDAQTLALLSADAAYDFSLNSLRQLVGGEVNKLMLLADFEPEPLHFKTLEEWQQQAQVNNNAIQAAKALEQVSYFELRAKSRASLPKVQFAASYIDENLSGGQGFSPESTSTAYGIEMKWPLYQGGGVSAARKQAAYRLQESQENLRLLQQNIDSSILRTVLAIEIDIKRYKAAKRVEKSTQSMNNVATKAYQNGSGTMAAWFETEKKLIAAKQQLNNIRFDYIEHRLSLLRLSGELSIKDLEVINAWLAHK
jgi:outer membrane protein